MTETPKNLQREQLRPLAEKIVALSRQLKTLPSAERAAVLSELREFSAALKQLLKR